ncbi:MAG: hypothetical protein A2Y77_16490 [Planctomycetes bacterium RBG_13_62_9]|nr:MAG: hypothetical protein A2Y77_16490 [Planctomycetes bacterium RBG_13_62_9]
MSLIEIEWHPSNRQLRVFGVSGLLASIAAALILHFAWGVAASWAMIVFAAGVAIFLCSLVSPRVTRFLYLGLTIVGMPLGFVVSFVLLAVFYFLLLTPLALFFRLIGRDPLCRSWRGRPAPASKEQEQGPDGLATSYWVPHRPCESIERYFHQS